jgi:hypothetical protein
MALLDLQGMTTPEFNSAAFGGSSNSGHSCTGSDLSVGLCEEGSGLSVILCGH